MLRNPYGWTLHAIFQFATILFIQGPNLFTICDEVENTQMCGTLYAGPNFSDHMLSFKNQDYSLDLREDAHDSDFGWNITKSLFVENGCAMQVCNQTYLDGHCEIFTSSSNILSNFSSGISSVSCTCSNQCGCETSYIKKSLCGRAYLEGGCNTCSSYYLGLLINHDKTYTFPEEFSTKVEAIHLRKGCVLTTYSQKHFRGKSKVFSEEIIHDFQSKIGSYKCNCDDTVYQSPSKIARHSSYPEMLNISLDMDNLITMLLKNSTSKHPGFVAARESFGNSRSSKNAYILVVGTTGAGKSSAINFLIGNDAITRVGHRQSTTSEIHEFHISVPLEELGISNSELRIIDTPGMGDTRGLEQDAKYLATLDNYLTTHEELKDRIPNLVLIFHKFSDNRFDGESSNFVKMIRGFDSFRKRITDDKFSNVIFVFSHFMAVDRNTRRRPGSRIQAFKEVIQNYTLFPMPAHIVLAENKAMEEELPMLNGYYKLPNNDFYPKNLLNKMDLITQKCGDPIGQAIFKTAFQYSEIVNVSRVDYPLLSLETPLTQHYFGVLTNANLNIGNSEISQHLQKVWDSEIGPELKTRYPFSLAYLQKALSLRNIHNMRDVPRTTTKILELLAALKQDPVTRLLLEKALRIHAPQFPHTNFIGFGYNVFHDKPLHTTPFESNKFHDSENGFKIPDILSCSVEPEEKEHFVVFEDQSDYLNRRYQSLGIQENISTQKFTDFSRPGFNMRENLQKSNSCFLSAIKDFRLFQLTLNDELTLSYEFENTVKSLGPVNVSDYSSVARWTNFFNIYGTHVIKSAYGGGSIEIQVESQKQCSKQLENSMFLPIRFAEDFTSFSNNETTYVEMDDKTFYSTIFSGGNSDFHSTNLGDMPFTKASQLLQNWKQSLASSPILLLEGIRLLQISKAAEKLGQNYSEEISRATRLLFDSALIYQPLPPVPDPNLEYCRGNLTALNDVIEVMKQQINQTEQTSVQRQDVINKVKEERDAIENQRLNLERETNLYKIQCQAEKTGLAASVTKERQECDKKMEEAKLDSDTKIARLVFEIKVTEIACLLVIRNKFAKED